MPKRARQRVCCASDVGQPSQRCEPSASGTTRLYEAKFDSMNFEIAAIQRSPAMDATTIEFAPPPPFLAFIDPFALGAWNVPVARSCGRHAP